MRIDLTPIPEEKVEPRSKHPKCLGTYDAFFGDFDCDYGSNLTCDDCKYGLGHKDPEAACNHID